MLLLFAFEIASCAIQRMASKERKRNEEMAEDTTKRRNRVDLASVGSGAPARRCAIMARKNEQTDKSRLASAGRRKRTDLAWNERHFGSGAVAHGRTQHNANAAHSQFRKHTVKRDQERTRQYIQLAGSKLSETMVKRKGNAMSKTKALATKRKTGGPAFKAKAEGTPKEVLLSQMMEQYTVDKDKSLSFGDILKGLGMNDRNTGWRNAWKDLEKNGLIEAAAGSGSTFTSGFRLTEKGREEASTEEYEELMKRNKGLGGGPKTNEELHERIKGKLMNERGEQIFDLLLQHGTLSRKELAKHLGISDTGAYFSYALQQLKDLGYAENVSGDGRGKKVRLTDQAFVDPGGM